MQQWEYLFLEIVGHDDTLRAARNMLVTSSDGRWQEERMPMGPASIVNQLGAEGWEMIERGAHMWMSSETGPGFSAVFKRPKQ